MDNTTDIFLIPLRVLVASIIFFKILKSKLSSLAKPDAESVFVKFHVADLKEPQANKSRSQWQKAFNTSSSRCFDFFMCKLGYLIPIAVNKLDDKSNNAKKDSNTMNYLKIPASKQHCR